ncbi:MAG TPA: hypothetical protein VKA67_01195, partial [Verrucomicrobiae bacterium]|nr:hypothetical protein [Verrucomicrobiae bacterium]
MVVLTALLVRTPVLAEDFGDIHVAPEAMYSGNTFHGYAEMRVLLENRSTSHAHDVTLAFPNRSWNSGNCIGTLSRSVRLGPGARALVPLLQPPLPVSGDGSIRVEVDGHNEGRVHAPNANNHMNRYGRGSTAVLFISRSLDSEAVERAFKANRGAFTPAMATGAPDAGRGGYQAKTWMPDTRRHGQTNWLELDYAKPLPADKVTVYATKGLPTSGEMLLFSASGSNLVRMPMSSAISPTSRSSEREFSFPVTREPVKKIQLNFGTAPAYNIGIDAVQLFGPSGNGWATNARAS